jgi:hypothetical protein
MKSIETLPTIPRIGGLHGNRLEITTLKLHSMNLTQGYICMYVCLPDTIKSNSNKKHMVKAHQKYKLSGFYNRDCSDSCLKDFDTTQSFGWIPMFWRIIMPSSVLLKNEVQS